MSSPSFQSDHPRASQIDDAPKPSHHGGLSHTSIALICAFVVCFTFFLYLSSKAPRISGPVRTSSVRPRRAARRRPKPKLWDVWLDQDHPDELKPPCNWRVSSPMHHYQRITMIKRSHRPKISYARVTCPHGVLTHIRYGPSTILPLPAPRRVDR